MRLDFHKNHRLLFTVVAFGFLGLSYLVAIGPAISVQASNTPLPGSRSLNALEQQGLEIYLAEGCVYCHTQQVRALPQDTLRYGRASVAADFARLAPTDVWRQTPRVLGSERTGPDLSNVGARQPSAVWHYIHLYQPRAVTAGSIMPAFPWLFDVRDSAGPTDVVIPIPAGVAPARGVVVARPEAKALVAYLLALHQPPLPRAATAASAAGPAADAGARVYESRCSSCHQPMGQGLPGAFPPLAGDPVVLAADPTRHVAIILFGLSGQVIGGTTYVSPMPAWADLLDDEDVAAVANHERSSWGNSAPRVTPEFVAQVRAGGPHGQ